LGPVEQRVAHFFTNSREETTTLTAYELGRRLATSDATIVRTAQALGYKGLTELKDELRRALHSGPSPARRLFRSLRDVGEPQRALTIAVDVQIQALRELTEAVPPDVFQRALDVLAEAERILVYGVGPSGSLADYFALLLTRIGRPAMAFS